MKEFAFDVVINAVVRVKAASRKEAERAVREEIDCADFSTVVFDQAVQVTEGSVDGPLDLFEVDGLAVDM